MNGINPGDGWRLLQVGERRALGDGVFDEFTGNWVQWDECYAPIQGETSPPARRLIVTAPTGDTLSRQLDETRAMLAASRQERDRLQVTINRLAVHLLNLDVAIGRVIVPDDVRSACKAALEDGR